MRWFTMVEARGCAYKVGNEYLPYWSRLAMLLYPDEFEGFFERRDARFDGTDAQLLAGHRAAEEGWGCNGQTS